MSIKVREGCQKILIMNTDLHCSKEKNVPEFFYFMSKFNDIIDNADTPFVITVGDFNSDVKSNQRFGLELIKFCNDEGSIYSPEDIERYHMAILIIAYLKFM